jgi:hypothetical protein
MDGKDDGIIDGKDEGIIDGSTLGVELVFGFDMSGVVQQIQKQKATTKPPTTPTRSYHKEKELPDSRDQGLCHLPKPISKRSSQLPRLSRGHLARLFCLCL